MGVCHSKARARKNTRKANMINSQPRKPYGTAKNSHEISIENFKELHNAEKDVSSTRPTSNSSKLYLSAQHTFKYTPHAISFVKTR